MYESLWKSWEPCSTFSQVRFEFGMLLWNGGLKRQRERVISIFRIYVIHSRSLVGCVA